jgi:hypothetical protein
MFPELMELAVGMLHKECILTVPLAFVVKDEGTGAELTPGQYRRLMKYKELDDPEKPGRVPQWVGAAYILLGSAGSAVSVRSDLQQLPAEHPQSTREGLILSNDSGGDGNVRCSMPAELCEVQAGCL